MRGVLGAITSRGNKANPVTAELRVHWQFFERNLGRGVMLGLPRGVGMEREWIHRSHVCS